MSKNYDHFIDVGAGDGYFVIGALKSNLFKTASSFEIEEVGKKIIYENARLNNVEDYLEIKGKVAKSDLQKIVKEKGGCAILIDIEGSEFDLLNEEILHELKTSSIIVELHDNIFNDLKEKRDQFEKRANQLFDVSIVSRITPEINSFEILDSWSDDERMIAFSEGRPAQMEWIVLTPKST